VYLYGDNYFLPLDYARDGLRRERRRKQQERTCE
jgi:hypothetical protein